MRDRDEMTQGSADAGHHTQRTEPEPGQDRKASGHPNPGPALRDLQVQSNQLYRAANDLQRTNRFQAMILDSINQGVVVIDEFEQLVAWNDEFLRLYGLSRTALQKGMCINDFSDLFRPLASNGTRAESVSVNDRLGHLKSGDYVDVRPDGTAIEIKVTTREAGGLIATYTDVTGHIATEARLREQRRQLEHQVTQLQALGKSLEEARCQAVRSDRDKSRFLAMISHDIRTPMSAIVSSLELLSGGEADADKDHLLQVALASGRQMLFLLSDIIDVSRADGWSFTIETDNVSIRDLLASTVAAWQPLAAARAITLDLSIAEAVPHVIQTDPKRLRQVLDNLLSNALKFTNGGEVTVQVDRIGAGGRDRLRIRVADSGRGISSDMQHKLFQEFGRIEADNAPEVEGTGLGLSICKRIIESMNGTIGVESAVGTGSVFWIELPCDTGALDQDAPAPESPRTAVYDGRKLRILVVDDNKINRTVLSASLDRFGCDCVQASDGQEALALVEAEDFDAVLMDNYMPGANGAEVTTWIRALPPPKNAVPIIGITASEDLGDHDALRQAGMTAVYTKPLGEAALVSILKICA